MSFHEVNIEMVPWAATNTKQTEAEYRIKVIICGIVLRSSWAGSKATAELFAEEINNILRTGIKAPDSIAGNMEFSRSEP